MTDRPPEHQELPASPTRIVVFLVIALSGGSALAYWLDRPTGPSCVGVLQARVTTVRCERAGRVQSVVVEEGQVVNPGDLLMTLSEPRTSTTLARLESEMVSLRQQLDRLEHQWELELEWRTKELDTEICEIQLKSAEYLKEKYDFELQKNMLADLLSEHQYVMLNDEADLFESIVIRHSYPKPEHLATVMHLEVASNAAEVSAAQVELCEQRETGLLRLKETLPQRLRKSLGIESVRSQLTQVEEELQIVREADVSRDLTSTVVGQIGRIFVVEGETLEDEMEVIEIVDDVDRTVQVDIPSQHILKFGVGTSVAIEFPGKAKRSGRVAKLAIVAEPSTNASQTVVPAVIEPAGKLWPAIPPGSQVLVYPAKQD
ncbi:MAG: HlyD family efflux transporter periplasmic adaptor subunit [Planctomycetaceae bacterium]|nr:HlyD family efflux transporter periplasmic adaptor subunit [Planctomycetaceae bacterium]